MRCIGMSVWALALAKASRKYGCGSRARQIRLRLVRAAADVDADADDRREHEPAAEVERRVARDVVVRARSRPARWERSTEAVIRKLSSAAHALATFTSIQTRSTVVCASAVAAIASAQTAPVMSGSCRIVGFSSGGSRGAELPIPFRTVAGYLRSAPVRPTLHSSRAVDLPLVHPAPTRIPLSAALRDGAIRMATKSIQAFPEIQAAPTLAKGDADPQFAVVQEFLARFGYLSGAAGARGGGRQLDKRTPRPSRSTRKGTPCRSPASSTRRRGTHDGGAAVRHAGSARGRGVQDDLLVAGAAPDVRVRGRHR